MQTSASICRPFERNFLSINIEESMRTAARVCPDTVTTRREINRPAFYNLRQDNQKVSSRSRQNP
eukprot:757836-Hanusia_phi.AAC.5